MSATEVSISATNGKHQRNATISRTIGDAKNICNKTLRWLFGVMVQVKLKAALLSELEMPAVTPVASDSMLIYPYS
jgi:hypothetical protein